MVEEEFKLIKVRGDESSGLIEYPTRGKVDGGAGQPGGGDDDNECDREGSNVTPDKLRFKVADMVTILTGQSAHHFSSVDPVTGHIIGAIAGNELFNLGGKDNKLGIVGKVVLDNIISEKFKRKTVTWSTGSEPYAKYIKDTSGIGSGRALISSPFDYYTDKFKKPEKSVHLKPPSPSDKVKTLDFKAERDRCLQDRRLFEDPEFPTCDKSLFLCTAPSKRIEWKRPGEIVDNPRLIYEGHSRFDVVQGLLSDCWLLAAVANLTLRDELFYRVVPPDQSFTENYAGIFHFQFWHYGQWVDVVVDDRLPTSNGELVYMHSRENNEFWSALLEKAYAKLFGSYEALKGGATAEALEDMTGGLTEFYDLENPPENLKEIMERGFEKGSLFGCSIEADPHEHEKRMLNGLVKGHAYSITGMRIVNGRRGRTTILRIRNPWGNEQEWNGPWSDRSLEWRRISEQEKEEMDLKIEHDGEFWISFDDFVRNFQRLGICNLGPEVMDEVAQMTDVRTQHHTWTTFIYHGEWIKNQTSGGCRKFIDTFAQNPQYLIHLSTSDPDDDCDRCTVIVAVMQKYRRELQYTGIENASIGFAVYNADGTSGRLDEDFFRSNRACARSDAFINLREVTARFRVPPGDYVIIPSTYEPNVEAQFLLRIYANEFMESMTL